MKIYTRTGDDGTTGLLGGVRVPKDDQRIAAHGAIDELNASLGVCRATGLPADIEKVVGALQHQLFMLGAELASPDGAPRGTSILQPADVEQHEAAIDRFEQVLAPLACFILPGGAPAAAALHMARCICRRAEREMVSLGRQSPVRSEALVFVNRVSDLLFVLARAANAAAGVHDVPWEKR